MVALSALVFALSWWLGLYLLARDPRKPVLAFAAIGLTSFALVVALDAVRVIVGSDVLSRLEIYLVAVPGTGAYCRSLSNQYNHTPRPPVIAVRDGVARVIVRRETIDDLLALDVDEPIPLQEVR